MGLFDRNNEKKVARLEQDRRRAVEEALVFPETNYGSMIGATREHAHKKAAEFSVAGHLAVADAMRPGTVAPTVDRTAAVTELSAARDSINPLHSLQVLSGFADVPNDLAQQAIADGTIRIDRLNRAIQKFRT